MKAAKVLIRVLSILALSASTFAVPGASASTGKPVNVTVCAIDAQVVGSDPLVIRFTMAFIPDVGPGGKEGFEGIVTGPDRINIKPNSATGEATLHANYEFDGLVWEAGNPRPWSGHLDLLSVGKGGPTDATGKTRTLGSRVHFVGTWGPAPERASWCKSQGYLPSAERLTGEVHVDPVK